MSGFLCLHAGELAATAFQVSWITWAVHFGSLRYGGCGEEEARPPCGFPDFIRVLTANDNECPNAIPDVSPYAEFVCFVFKAGI